MQKYLDGETPAMKSPQPASCTTAWNLDSSPLMMSLARQALGVASQRSLTPDSMDIGGTIPKDQILTNSPELLCCVYIS
jgi:hypothetical protein